MPTLRTTLVIAMCSACGGGGSDPVVLPDAPVSTVDAAPPNAIEIRNFGDAPVFISYRTDGGAWQVPDQISTSYEMRVHDTFELVAVCGNATTGYEVAFEAGTFQETGATMYMPCFGNGPSPGAVTVSGTMVQPGTVTMVDTATSDTADWSFALDVPTGTHTLVAAGAGRVVLRRGVAIAGPTTVPAIDVAAAGVALSPLPLTLTGALPDDTVTTESMLATQTQIATIAREDGTTAQLVPAAELVASDRHYSLVMASAPTRQRYVFVNHGASSSTSFTLLPPLEGIAFADRGASWTTIPAGEVYVSYFAATRFVHFRASQGWIGTKTTLAIDTDIPGFRAEWQPGAGDTPYFSVTRYGSGVQVTTAVSPAATVARAAAARGELERARALRATLRTRVATP